MYTVTSPTATGLPCPAAASAAIQYSYRSGREKGGYINRQLQLEEDGGGGCSMCSEWWKLGGGCTAWWGPAAAVGADLDCTQERNINSRIYKGGHCTAYKCMSLSALVESTPQASCQEMPGTTAVHPDNCTVEHVNPTCSYAYSVSRRSAAHKG